MQNYIKTKLYKSVWTYYLRYSNHLNYMFNKHWSYMKSKGCIAA